MDALQRRSSRNERFSEASKSEDSIVKYFTDRYHIVSPPPPVQSRLGDLRASVIRTKIARSTEHREFHTVLVLQIPHSQGRCEMVTQGLRALLSSRVVSKPRLIIYFSAVTRFFLETSDEGGGWLPTFPIAHSSDDHALSERNF